MKSPLHDLEFGAAAQALSALDRLDVAELEVLYRLERTAGEFYERLADRVDDPAVAGVLRRNAREEFGHAKRALRALSIKGGPAYRAPPYLELTYSVAAPERVGHDMLLAMVHGERAGDADYQRWAASELDPEIARLLRISGKEETTHAERLSAAMGLP